MWDDASQQEKLTKKDARCSPKHAVSFWNYSATSKAESSVYASQLLESNGSRHAGNSSNALKREGSSQVWVWWWECVLQWRSRWQWGCGEAVVCELVWRGPGGRRPPVSLPAGWVLCTKGRRGMRCLCLSIHFIAFAFQRGKHGSSICCVLPIVLQIKVCELLPQALFKLFYIKKNGFCSCVMLIFK